MEPPSSLKPVLQWACRDQTLAERYHRVLNVEGVQSIEDLSELTLEDMKEVGIKEAHAKKLERKCKKIRVKISVGAKENVVGIIQVPRGMKLLDVRRVIARDQLPQVPASFQFRMDEMAVITEAQEGTWDAEVFTDDTGNSICILVPQKGNKGASVSSMSGGRNIPSTSLPAQRPQPKDSTHRVTPQQHYQTHNPGFFHPTSQQPARKMPPNNQPVFTEPLPAASSTLPPLEELQPLIRTSGSSHLSTKDLVDSSQMRVREGRSDVRAGQGVGGVGGKVETVKRLSGQAVVKPQKQLSPDRARPPRYRFSRNQVYIGGLTGYGDRESCKVKDIDLVNAFVYKYGHVKDYTRQAPNYAFVAYTYPESARACINELNGREFQQFRFVCRYATKHFEYDSSVPFAGGRVRLTGVTEDMESKGIMRMFKRFGMIVNIVLSPSKRTGLVMFEVRRSAERAVDEFGEFVWIRGVRVGVRLEEEEEVEEWSDGEFGEEEEDGIDDMVAVRDRLQAVFGPGDATEREEAQRSSSGAMAMERVIESYINGATVDIVRMKLRDLVSAERDMKLLCTLLLENGIQRPGQIASCCKELVEAQFQLQDVGYSYGSFKTILLGKCQAKLIEILESGASSKANELKSLMSFLAHLYNEMVITSSVVFGCANRVLDGATPEFVVSVQHLLGAAERHLLCDDQVKTGNLKRRVMEAKRNLVNGTPINPTNKDTTPPSVSAAVQQNESHHLTSKQQLGNELYQKIYANHPGMAAKITGMLLHSLDEQLLRHLITSPHDLRRKVAEAVQVIGQHATGNK